LCIRHLFGWLVGFSVVHACVASLSGICCSCTLCDCVVVGGGGVYDVCLLGGFAVVHARVVSLHGISCL